MDTNSEKETINKGIELAGKLKGGEIILLYGDLGTGKTQFVKGIAEGLGVEEGITSPTFVLMKQFDIKKEGLSTLYHIDLYRIDSQVDLASLGLDDAFRDENGVVVIEWADRLKGVPEGAITVNLEYSGESSRKIEIKK